MESRFLGKLNPCLQGYLAGANAGKTTVMFTDAVDLASAGKRVTIVSLETTCDVVVNRLVKIAGEDKIADIMDYINIIYIPVQNATITRILALMEAKECDVMILDYIDLIKYDNRNIRHNDALISNCSVIDQLSRDLNIPFITSLQMRRESLCLEYLSPIDEYKVNTFDFVVVRRKENILTIDDENQWEIGKTLKKVEKD